MVNYPGSVIGAVAFIIFALAIVPPLFRSDPVCIDRDAEQAERLFLGCLNAVKAKSGDTRQCRQDADELSCKTWRRP